MARQLVNASSQFLDVGTWDGAGGGSALTMVCWVYLDSIPNSDFRYFSKAINTSANNHTIMLSNNDASVVELRVRLKVAGTVTTHIGDTQTESTGEWIHAGFTWSSADDTIRTYFNGGVDASTTTTSTGTIASNAQRFIIGANPNSSNETRWMDGRIAEVCAWSAALNANEFSALASGVVPNRVRPQSIIAYWPIWGVHSPEPELTGNGPNATLDGAPAFGNHPPIVRTRKTFHLIEESVPPVGGLSIPVAMHNYRRRRVSCF
jgi:hypothetical protein